MSWEKNVMMPIKDNRIVENDLQNITETVSVIVPVYNVSSYLNKCMPMET